MDKICEFKSKLMGIQWFAMVMMGMLCFKAYAGTGEILFQPQFLWADGSCSQAGTGSFVQGPNGNVIGLTSAHIVNFEGSGLVEVQYLDIRTGKVVGKSVESWGLPGRGGNFQSLDLKTDYLLLLMKGEIGNCLELDSRSCMSVGERVWFPNKNAETDSGYIEGAILEVSENYLVAILDNFTNLKSCSGTPIISQLTGKIIGILTAGNDDGKMIYLTPATCIVKALEETQTCYLLRDVVGKTH